MVSLTNLRHDDRPGIVKICRPSPLGNPWSHKAGTLAQYQVATRDEAIRCYLDWLAVQLLKPTPQRTEMLRLARLVEAGQSLTLGCFCWPHACHGDLICRLLNNQVWRQQFLSTSV